MWGDGMKQAVDALLVLVVTLMCAAAGGIADLVLWGLSAWIGFGVPVWVWPALPIGGGLIGFVWAAIEVNGR